MESPDASTLMDNYADGLMNELFDDVEQALEGSLELPDQPFEPDPAPEPVSMPQITLPPALVQPASSDLETVEPDAAELDLVRQELEKAKRREKRLDFLMLGAAFATLLLTVGIWLMNRQALLSPQSNPPAPPTPEELQAQADAEFLQYLDRSLDVVERKAQAQSTTASAAPADGLPRVMVPNNPGQPSVPGQASVIERIYVPLYQPPSASGSAAVPFRNFALQYGNQIQNNSNNQNNQTAPPAASTAETPDSSPSPAATTPTTPAPSPSTTATAPSAPAPANLGSTYTLVGIMELGDRSAALFEVDGTTQRFFVGEPIGSSGWTLAAVDNQEAMIRRNGEVRSIFVGQKF
jgi:hypothetical protein